LAQVGQTYPLVEQSNCRYTSGRCDLENVEFKASLTYIEGTDGGYLQLDSSHPLSGALVSLALPGFDSAPVNMDSGIDSAKRWALALPNRPAAAARIRLVLSRAGSAYFVDASTAFLQQP
jgi:hypothetical protein